MTLETNLPPVTPIEEDLNTLDIPLKKRIPWNLETLLVIIIIGMAIFSRFYDLGARVLSHDEVNHVIPGYDFYSGLGYRYDPLSHGPFQFHMIAFSYFLFGDNEFANRIPAAVFSVITVVIALLAFRRYLGRVGALIAGVMFLISPYMLFYGRYQRNEAFIVVWGMVTIYAILRYLERGETWVLFLFTAINAFHFIDKATSFIFAAQQLIFLAVYFIDRLTRREWSSRFLRQKFILAMAAMILLLTLAGGLYVTLKPASTILLVLLALLALIGLIAGLSALVIVIKGVGWAGIRSERTFDLLMLLGTLILPLLGALPIKLAKFNPLDYTPEGITRSAIVIGILLLFAIVLGYWWGKKQWLLHMALFYSIFVVFYSTFFTNFVQGVAGGFMGALGYWMEQQAVNRGGQPAYYYALLQIPVYEFLPAAGVLLAIAIAWVKNLWKSYPGKPYESAKGEEVENPAVPTVVLLLFWSFSSLVAFTLAGEKMPWLTIHIAMPMILVSGWAIGWLTDWGSRIKLQSFGWRNIVRTVTLVFLAILAVLTARTAYRAAYINYDYPFEYLVYAHAADGPKILLKAIEDISQRTTGGLDIVVAYDNNTRYPYWWYMRHFPNRIDFGTEPTKDIQRAAVIVVSEENYGKIASVVRDNYVQFDFMRMWWPNQDYWSLKWDNISAEYRAEIGQDAPPMSVIEYLKRAWRHISPFFTDAKVRSAIWQIWFNRNYTEYAALKNSNAFTLENWNTGSRMRAYIRKDVASLVWGFASATNQPVTVTDPYETLKKQLTPDLVVGLPGSENGQFQAPRSLAVAPDGTIYVADSRNNRIQHLNAKGEFINSWGRFADVAQGDAPGGTFNEPWGIAVAPNGNVYVVDTWNYRVQKFTAAGKFISMWGTNGFGNTPMEFYGPRGVTVDKKGNVYVVDTGNKRIVVFDAKDNYLTQFGTPGMEAGELDEPVGIALDDNGLAYITDTWNQRVQVFAPDPTGMIYTSIKTWDVSAWFGQSLENKPFIAVDKNQNVFISDPEGCRVIEFSSAGVPIRTWGDCGFAENQFSLPVGLAFDESGGLWISDAGENNRLLHFPASLLTLP
jgi:predicted membrane-bound mannosyltransferase/DNA-binding beta-propeller fold protein YncE